MHPAVRRIWNVLFMKHEVFDVPLVELFLGSEALTELALSEDPFPGCVNCPLC